MNLADKTFKDLGYSKKQLISLYRIYVSKQRKHNKRVLYLDNLLFRKTGLRLNLNSCIRNQYVYIKDTMKLGGAYFFKASICGGCIEGARIIGKAKRIAGVYNPYKEGKITGCIMLEDWHLWNLKSKIIPRKNSKMSAETEHPLYNLKHESVDDFIFWLDTEASKYIKP